MEEKRRLEERLGGGRGKRRTQLSLACWARVSVFEALEKKKEDTMCGRRRTDAR